MKAVFVFLTFLAIGYTVAKHRSFEDIDVNVYKNDGDRLDGFCDCITGDGPCDEQEDNFRARCKDIVKTHCEDCTEKEKHITHDLFSLIANEVPYTLHTILQVLDPDSSHSKSFLSWLLGYNTLGGILSLPTEIIDEFDDYDDYDDYDYDVEYNGGHHYGKKGTVLGGVGKLVHGVLKGVGI